MQSKHACLQSFFRLFQKNMIPKVKIDIVYFVVEHQKNLLQEIQQQWSELVQTGIMDMPTTFHIVFSQPYDQNFPLHDLKKLIPRHDIRLHFTQSDKPYYILYQLAEKNPSPSHYIFYFDNKDGGGKLVSQWKKVLSMFRRNPSIDKIGLDHSHKCWWIRASYLSEKSK